jgi:hypothetical protein
VIIAPSLLARRTSGSADLFAPTISALVHVAIVIAFLPSAGDRALLRFAQGAEAIDPYTPSWRPWAIPDLFGIGYQREGWTSRATLQPQGLANLVVKPRHNH